MSPMKFIALATTEKTRVGTGHTKTKFLTQRRYICPRGTKGKGIETEDEEREWNKGEREGIFVLEDKG